MKNNKLFKIFVFSIILLLVLGSTYAYWTWNSTNNKNVVFSTAGISEYIIYDEGESYFVGNYQPYVNFCESVHTTISIYKTSDALSMDLRATIKMDVNDIGENISLSDNVYYVVTSGDSNITCNNGLSESSVIASGTFNGVSSGQTLDLASNIEVTTEEEKYTIWIWLDASGEDISSLSLETLDTNIWTLISMADGSSIVANDDIVSPVITDGMIPVVISDDGIVTTVLEDDSSWYDYTEQRWANAILVSESSRSSYLNTSDVIVNSSDILAYYVWIPRYKYRIWTKGVSSSGKEQTIDIVFESKDTPKSTGKEVGEYLTHPAFTFGTEELDGFWVGKFETTGSGDSPTILPNVRALAEQDVSTQFATSLKFAGGTLLDGTVYFDGNSFYGLTSETNSHMMKNSEWGAVAYLSHSLYGINKKIRLNNNSYFITSCGASIQSNNSSSASCRYSFGTSVEYPQTTTGNITGIYDMSGGSAEYVMGNYSSISDRSGFTTFPQKKYYDEYTSNVFIGDYSTNFNFCTINNCGGHALYETFNWYDGFNEFIHSSGTWFVRGNYQTGYNSAGIFSSDDAGGSSYSTRSWRSVLTKTQYMTYYSVTYDANGGSNAPSKQIINEDNPSVSISNIIPTREGYRFLNWNTESDGSGITYQAGDTYNNSANITLYAQWQELLTPTLTTSVSSLNIKMTSTGSGNFTYTYNGDGNVGCESSNTSIATCTISNGVVYVTAKSTGDVTVTLTTTATSTYLSTSVNVAVNISLQTYTISYNANGGSGAPSSQTKTYGVTLTLSDTIPTRTGYIFLGWSTSSSATSATYAAGGSYTSNSAATLYAVWEIDTYTVTYINNIFDIENGTKNGVSLTYNNDYNDSNIYNLTLNGTITTTWIDFISLTDMTFKNGDQYSIELTYISGNYSSSGQHAFVVETIDSSGDEVSTRNYADTALPTSGTNKNLLTINSASISEGTGLDIWLWSEDTGGMTFNNYVVRVIVSKVSTKNIQYNDNYVLPDTPTKTGYKFIGWYLSDGTRITNSTVMNKKYEHSVFAVWTPKTYTVTYINNIFDTENSTKNGVSVTYNNDYNDSNIYNLTLNGTITTTWVNFISLTDMTFKEGEQYSIELTYISGNYSSSNNHAFVVDILNSSEEQVSTRNYSDTGLPTSGTNKNLLTINSASISEGTGLKIWLWSEDIGGMTFNNYVVRVIVSKVSTKNIQYNDNYVLPDTPTKTGYKFIGWYLSDGTQITNSTVMNKDYEHSVFALWKATLSIPKFTYTGTYQIVDDSDNTITNILSYAGNWKIRFLTSGTLTISSSTDIDIFVVGGGGGGGYSGDSNKHYGGGGGYTKTYFGYTLSTGSINVIVGDGGTVFNSGGTSSFGTVVSAAGGTSPTASAGGSGGSGGGGLYWDGSVTYGGVGGSDGSNGGGTAYYGTGQGTTTREFGESLGTLYAGGGGAGTYGDCGAGAGGSGGGGKGACYYDNAVAGTANTGGGGGGGYFPSSEYGSAAAGGSGIVIIRNHR